MFIVFQNYSAYFQIFFKTIFIILDGFSSINDLVLPLLAQQFKMIQSGTFSMEQSQNILKTFLIDYDMNKVIQKFVKREASHLRDQLKRIIRETIINIEAQLFKAEKISYLLLYDNQSEQMFEEFLNLKDILQDSQKDNFFLNFVNMKSEGCRILRYGRTDYHVSINSEQRERIYANFIDYTNNHKLYRFAITTRDENQTSESPPYLDPTKLFKLRDLELVLKIYNSERGDLVNMVSEFKKRGMTDEPFQIQNLDQNIQNLLLIGCFNGYKKYCQKLNTEPMKWSQFKDKYPIPEEAEIKAKCLLIRVAIRNDLQPQELSWFERYQSKKLPNMRQKPPPVPKKGTHYKFKKWRKDQEKAQEKIYGVLAAQIKNQIDHPSQYYDSKSMRSMSSFRPQIQSKSELKRMPIEVEDDEESRQSEEEHLSKKQRDPNFLKKIQKQSLSQRVIEEQDEKDVVWEEIPEKSNSQHPNQSNSASGKFYSEKMIYDKMISMQQSMRSQKFKMMSKPKKIKIKKKQQSKEGRKGQNQEDSSDGSMEDNYELENGQGDYSEEQESN